MKYGLIGEKLGHSFSKEIHSLIADYEYNLIEIEKPDLRAFMTSRDFLGINVTIPYKKDVMEYLDYIDKDAKSIGAVNTIVNRNGKLFGYNTDFYGLKSLILKAKIDVLGKRAVILGAGGTSNTAKAVLESLGAKKVLKVARTKREEAITFDELYEIASSVDVIVNATPVGTFPNLDDAPVDLQKFTDLSGVIDVVYNPLETKLVKTAKSFGIKAEGGLYMLVAQAVKASEIFLDTEYDKSVLEGAFNKVYLDKQNVVLTGMPASGKSTVGKILAKKLNREFIDTDLLIEEETKKTIPQIFKEVGEVGFRKIEKACVKKASALSGKVIATGGGAILDSENIFNLKQNGKIFFIDRPLKNLVPTSDRPLSLDKDAIEKRYNERYDIYVKTADKKIDAECSAQEVADRILRSIK